LNQDLRRWIVAAEVGPGEGWTSGEVLLLPPHLKKPSESHGMERMGVTELFLPKGLV
jgi:hypothetical protein